MLRRDGKRSAPRFKGGYEAGDASVSEILKNIKLRSAPAPGASTEKKADRRSKGDVKRG